MTTTIRHKAIAVFLIVMGTGEIALAAMPEHPSWMAGCWQHANGATQETWETGFDGLMFGRSVTVNDGKLIEFEDMRIQRRGNKLLYSASPNGREATAFVSADQTKNSISFENAAHDFPQRISYTKTTTGMSATISSLDGSNAITFNMNSCTE